MKTIFIILRAQLYLYIGNLQLHPVGFELTISTICRLEEVSLVGFELLPHPFVDWKKCHLSKSSFGIFHPQIVLPLVSYRFIEFKFLYIYMYVCMYVCIRVIGWFFSCVLLY